LRVSEPMSLSFAVENILDHHYRTYSSGISAPGRNLIISLRGNF
jgi:hemoglobin/transferrin/lactoferrin receptor protein